MRDQLSLQVGGPVKRVTNGKEWCVIARDVKSDKGANVRVCLCLCLWLCGSRASGKRGEVAQRFTKRLSCS